MIEVYKLKFKFRKKFECYDYRKLIDAEFIKCESKSVANFLNANGYYVYTDGDFTIILYDENVSNVYNASYNKLKEIVTQYKRTQKLYELNECT